MIVYCQECKKFVNPVIAHVCITQTSIEYNREFPDGKENYCPRCYFDNDKIILKKDCPHNKQLGKRKIR